MKKFISAALALAMVLSFASASFAEIGGYDAIGGKIKASPVDGNARAVYATESGDYLEVTGNVTGKTGMVSVEVKSGAQIKVGGYVEEWDDGNAVHALGGRLQSPAM